RARGGGGADRLVVLTPCPPATRVQPQGRMPRADRVRPKTPFPLELPQSRKGLRRPDAAPTHANRRDASIAAREGLGASGAGACDGEGSDGSLLPHGVIRGGGGNLVGHPRAGDILRGGARAARTFRVVSGHAGETGDQRPAP